MGSARFASESRALSITLVPFGGFAGFASLFPPLAGIGEILAPPAAWCGPGRVAPRVGLACVGGGGGRPTVHASGGCRRCGAVGGRLRAIEYARDDLPDGGLDGGGGDGSHSPYSGRVAKKVNQSHIFCEPAVRIPVNCDRLAAIARLRAGTIDIKTVWTIR
jgi:hypothetical protein